MDTLWEMASVPDRLLWQHLKHTQLASCAAACRSIAWSELIVPLSWLAVILLLLLGLGASIGQSKVRSFEAEKASSSLLKICCAIVFFIPLLALSIFGAYDMAGTGEFYVAPKSVLPLKALMVLRGLYVTVSVQMTLIAALAVAAGLAAATRLLVKRMQRKL